MLLIKRYPNRKLYDTEAKRYVTLQDVALHVQAGREIQVVDQETGQDVTEATLARIVLDQARQRATSLSRSVLAHVIRAGPPQTASWRQQLAHTVEHLESEGELSPSAASQLLALGKQAAPSDEEGTGVLERQVRSLIGHLGLPSHDDLERLRHQLDQLSLKLDSLDADHVDAKDVE